MKSGQKIKITLIGDVFPAERPFTLGFGVKSQFAFHNGEPWKSKIKAIIGKNDLAIGNLESPLLSNSPEDKKTFYGLPSFSKFLINCGINVVNIANNHILEHGEKGFNDTIGITKNAGLEIVGVSEQGLSNIIIKEIKGKRIAIAGYSDVDLHVINNNGCFPVLNKENVLKTVEVMNEKQADIKILCFHWGNEYIHIPALYQRELAHAFVDAGVDIIAGHHSHVIQPYEKYNNGHIFYSLGNFMFDSIHSKMFSIGLIATLEIDENNNISTFLKGVKLSDKNLIEPYNDKKFSVYYKKIESLYVNSKQFSDDEYSKAYSRIRIKNRSRQRVLMKLSVIKELFRIKWINKKLLLKNLISYYSNYFRK